MAKVDRNYCMLPCDVSYDPLYGIWIRSKSKWLRTDILGTSYYSPMTNISFYWKVSGEQEYREDGIIVYYRWKVPLVFI